MKKTNKKMYMLAVFAVLLAAAAVGMSDAGSEDVSADTTTGEIKRDSTTIGTWTYDSDTHILTLAANSATPGMPTSLAGFSGEAGVTSVILTGTYYTYGFKTDITSFFSSTTYTSLGGNIVYKGDLLSYSNTGTWIYDTYHKTLTISKDPSSPTTLPSYGSTGAPWYSYYFRSECTEGTIAGFTNGGQNLFNGLSSMKILKSTSMTSINSPLFTGSSIENINMGNLSSTVSNLSPLKDTLVTLNAPNLTSIAANSFYEFSKLENVQIGGSGVMVYDYAFWKCTKLRTISTGGIVSVGKGAFAYCSAMEADEHCFNALATIAAGDAGTGAFYRCDKITKINMPYLNNAGAYAFCDCKGLASVISLGSVGEIPNCMFDGCTLLSTVTIPSSASKIGGYAFRNSIITEISLPGTTEICANGMRGCGALTTVTLGNSLAIIRDSAFKDCQNLAGTITFPNTLTTIEKEAFMGDYKIKVLSFTGGGSATVAIGNKAFYGCLGITTVGFGPVREIGNEAFYGCSNLTDITLPPTVASVGDRAFEGCTILSSVTITNGTQAVSVGAKAFYNCTCISSLNLGDRVTSIGNDAFFGCTGIANTVTFPSTVTSVGDRAFEGCTVLKKAEFVDGTQPKSIGLRAFYGCMNMTSLVLGEGISSIGNEAFQSCTSLNGTVTFPSTLKTLGDNAFRGCNLLGKAEFTGTPSVGDVITIGNYAFRDCTSMTSLVLGDKIESIGTEAFRNCRGITGTITFPAGFTTLGSGAFYDCTALEDIDFNPTCRLKNIEANTFRNCNLTGGTIDFHNDLESIGDSAFSGCKGLVGITFSVSDSKLKSIQQGAFYKTEALGTVTFPDSLETFASSGTGSFQESGITGIVFGTNTGTTKINSIPQNTFYSCKTLVGPVAFPDSVASIGNYAFRDCTNLKGISFGKATSVLATIGYGAFYGCTSMDCALDLPDSLNTIYSSSYYPTFGNTALSSVTFGSGLITLGSYAFSNLPTITGTVELPKSLVTVEEFAFRGCTGITKLSINDQNTTLQTVGRGAFSGCTSMAGDIELPSSVKSIGLITNWDATYGSFYSTKITKISSSGTLTVGRSAFYNCTDLTNVHFPNVTSIGYCAFYNCTSLANLNIMSVTTMESHAFYGCASLTSVDISSIDRVENYTFCGCTNLETVNLPATTFLGSQAFRNCTSLETAYTPSLKTISDSAFFGCEDLSNINLTGVIGTIGQSAFYNCSSIQSVDIPSATAIGAYTFQHCTSIKEINIPYVESVGIYAFYNCSSLEEVEAPRLTTMNAYSFQSCTSLKSVSMDILTATGSQGFLGCTSLIEVYMPLLVTLNSSTFSGCNKLETIALPKVATIGPTSFQNCSKLKTVTTSTDLTSIGYSAFVGCPMLEGGLTLDSVTEVGSSAFQGCSVYTGNAAGIVNLTSVVTLNDYAFYNTAIKTFNIGEELKNLGLRPLYNDSLETITVASGNPYFSTQKGILYDNQKTIAYICPPATTYTSIALPDSVARIDNYCFYKTSNLTQISLITEVDLTIGDYAFQYSGLTSLVLPIKITKVGMYAFSYCTNLTSVTVEFVGAKTFINQTNPSYNISDPRSYQFNGCTSLKTITYPNTVEIQRVFHSCPVNEIHITGIGASGLPSNYYYDAHYTMPWYNTTWNEQNRITVYIENGVTKIDDSMFNNRYSYNYSIIKSVYIADTVTEIGNLAFKDCSRLEEIVFPNSLTTMSANSLQNCNNLKRVSLPITFDWSGTNVYPTGLTEITFKKGTNGAGFNYTEIQKTPSTQTQFWKSSSSYRVVFGTGITHIGEYSCLKSSTDAVTIPASVQSIGKYAFLQASMTNVIIEDGLRTLGDNAFSNCTGLISVTIPNTFEDYTGYPFQGCTSISTAYLPITLEYEVSEGKSLFYGCSNLYRYNFTPGTDGEGAIYNADKAVNTPWYASCRDHDRNITVTFSDGVYSVGNYMFYGCSVVKSGNTFGVTGNMSFPNTLKSIGEGAFQNCTKITGVNFGNTLESVGKNAFAGCTGITASVFASTDTTFGDNAFAGCTGMKQLTVPASFDTVGNTDAPIFEGCTGLTTLNLVGSVASHNYTDTDYMCTPWYYSKANIITLNIESAVTSLGNNMFRGCTGISGSLVLSQNLATVGTKTFAGCTGITALTLTSVSVIIGPNAFRDCTGIASLTIPAAYNSVRDVNAPIFENCTGITTLSFTGSGPSASYSESEYQKTPWYYSRNKDVSMTFAPTITTVGNNMFRGSGIIGTVTIGSNVATVGNNAFSGSTKIAGLVIVSSTTSLGENAFGGCTGLVSLEMPIEMNAVKFADAPIFGGCVGITGLRFTGVYGFYYTESGAEDYTKTPWYFSKNNTITVEFASTVKEIGNNMFRGCTGLDGDIILPDATTTIGNYAFHGCTGLDGFGGAKVTLLKNQVFRGATSLSTVSLPLVVTIPEYTFEGCMGLKKATITSCKTIGGHAFENSGIDTIESSTAQTANLAGIITIGDYAFAKSGLVYVVYGTLGTNLSMGDYVFFECASLKTVEINGTLTKLPYNTFRSADTAPTFVSQLKSIEANGVKTFAANLANFTALETVEIATATSFEENTNIGVFKGCTSLESITLLSDGSVNTITLPQSAFEGCTSLITINATNIILSKGREFYGCMKLNDVTVAISTQIPDYSFWGCAGLKVFSAPHATSVGIRSFENCGLTALDNTVLPSASSAGEYAFGGCASLTAVELPGMTNLGKYAFSGCTSLNSVTLPEVLVISEGLFYGCSVLNNVSLPKATSVGVLAFYNNTALTTVSLPKTSKIGDISGSAVQLSDCVSKSVFGGCGSLNTVNMPVLKSVGALAFYGCAGLSKFNSSETEAGMNLSGISFIGYGAFYSTGAVTVTVGSSGNVLTMGDYAFAQSSSLTRFTALGGLSSFGRDTFDNCISLERLKVPISVKWISDYKPSGIKNIEFTKGTVSEGCDYTITDSGNLLWSGSPSYSVTFEQGITKIGSRMYLAATGTVTVPSSVLSIGEYAFHGSPMTSVVMQNGLETLGDRAFGDCDFLTEAVIPNTLANFNGAPFSGCTALSKVTLPITFDFSGNRFAGCSSLNKFVFTPGNGGIGYDYSGSNATTTPWYLASTHGLVVSVSFTAGVKTIGTYMFYGCTAVTGTVDLAEITTVKAHAFDGASGISALHIRANTFGTPGESAFRGCVGLTTLTMPLTVNTVGDTDAAPSFEGCTSITSISFVGTGAGFAYTESGAGDYTKTPWYFSKANAITVTFGSGITGIGNNTFRGCTGLDGSITLPESVIAIGDYAFKGCTGLDIFDGAYVTLLRTEVFRGATSLSTVSLPSVVTIPGYTFEGCAGLTKATISSCKTIEGHAFENSGINTINSGTTQTADLTGVNNIREYAFAKSGLVDVTVKASGADLVMEDYVFFECASLKNVEIIGTLVKLPYNTFRSASTPSTFVSQLKTLEANGVRTFAANLSNFKSLETVEIATATSFDENTNIGVFKGCTSLVSITLLADGSSTRITLPLSAFEGCTSLLTVDATNLVLSKGREFYGCVKLNNVEVTNSAQVPDYSFYGCTALNNFKAPKATAIGIRSFENCGLTVLDDTVLPIAASTGEYAFAGCSHLASVNLPKMETLGKYTFRGCASLNSVALPEVLVVSEGLFYGCSVLNNVSAPKAANVGILAFYNNTALAAISLPKVETIGDVSESPVQLSDYVNKSVFGGCDSLGTVNMPVLKSVGALAFYGCAGLSKFNSSETEAGMNLSGVSLIRYGAFYGTGAVTVTVGSSGNVLTMGDYAFAQSTSLTRFTVLGSITAFGENTFNDCSLLEKLRIPISVRWVSAYKPTGIKNIEFTKGTFSEGCDYTEGNYGNLLWSGSPSYSVTFEQGITKIGNRMYLAATGTVTVPSSVLSIGEYAFHGSPMTSVVMQNGLQTLGDKAFGECTSLTEVVFPNTLANFNGAPFSGCINLSKVTLPITFDFSGNRFAGCSSLNKFVFTPGTSGDGYNYDEDKSATTPWYLASNYGLGVSVSFTAGVKTIGTYMFHGCTAVTGTVDLAGITAVRAHAFEGASGITTLHIRANTFGTPGESAFKGCVGLTTLTVPLTVNTVGSTDTMPAFEGCTSITSVSFVGTGAGFAYTESNAGNYTKTPWYFSKANAITVTFGSGITGIGNNTFRGCTGLDGNIVLPDATTAIGDYAFNGCTGLDGIEGPGVNVLRNEVFRGSTSLSTVSLPSVVTIPGYTFEGCTGLTDATITSCKTIEGHAFENSGINTINSPTLQIANLTNVNNIGDYAFAKSGLVEVTVGTAGTALVMGDYVFLECASLKKVEINGDLAKLPYNTFRSAATPSTFTSPLRTLRANGVKTFAASLTNFTSLKTVEIATATSLEENTNVGVFKGCVSLESITLLADGSSTRITLPQSAFEGCTSLITVNATNLVLSKGREFYGCVKLNNVEVTNSAQIPDYSFYGCVALDTFKAPSANAVGARSFEGCGLTVLDDTVLPIAASTGEYAFAGCPNLASVNLPKMATLGKYTFRECASLSSVALPEVLVISEGLFYGCSTLSSVSAPAATSVDVLAFYNNVALGTISLPKVETIGDVSGSVFQPSHYVSKPVFGGCTSLGSVNMPVLKSVGALAFYGCAGLNKFNPSETEAGMNLSASRISFIGYGAFYGTGAVTVTAGYSGTNLVMKDYAFAQSPSLTRFTVLGGLGADAFGENTFEDCSLLEKLRIPISVKWVSAYKPTGIKNIEFTKGTVSEGYDYTEGNYGNLLWSGSPSYSVTFEQGITKIGNRMYLAATGTVTVPSSVLSIGEYAFHGSPMTSVIMRDGLQSLGDKAFGGCTSLTEVVIPNTLANFNGAPFSGCTALSKVTLPITFDFSGNKFAGCKVLKEFVFTPGNGGVGYDYDEIGATTTPWYLASNYGLGVSVSFTAGVKTVGTYMFYGCTAVTGTVNLADITEVKGHAFENAINISALHIEANAFRTLGESAFKGCVGLTTLTMPLTVNAVGSAPTKPAFENCTSITSISFVGTGAGPSYADGVNGTYLKTPWYFSRTNVISVSFGPGITEIGNNTFRDCTGIAGDVDVSSVRTIGTYAFSGCDRMTGITGNSVTTMGAHAFDRSSAIVEAVMPALVSVPEYAFFECASLTNATLTACTSVGAHAFERSGINNVNNEGTGYSVNLAGVSSVGDYAFAESGVISITFGTAGSPIISFGDYVLFECRSLKDVAINGSLSKLPYNTFRSADTTSSFASRLSSIVANDTLTFAAYLKDNFKSLRTVEIRGATSFDQENTKGMFMNCTSLTTVVLFTDEYTSVYLPESAFEGCTSLAAINLDSIVLSKGREFYGCDSLNNIVLSKRMNIPNYSFYGCASLSVFSAEKVTGVGDYSFAECGFTTITDSMFAQTTKIGNRSFENCSALAAVSMSEVTSVGQYAFNGCSALAAATFARLGEISVGMFYECSSLASISADNVTKIRELAFYGCRALQSVVMNSVTEIGDVSASTNVSLNDYGTKAVFYNCVSLSSVMMPSIKSVGALAFYGCSTLASFNASGSMNLSDVESIRYGAFAGTGFVDVSVGKTNGIRDIGDYAFYGCARLEDFSSVSLATLPEHLFNNSDVSLPTASPMLTNISVPAVVSFNANLHGCKFLNTVSAPSATSFGNGTFYECTQLKTVELMNEPARGPAVVLSQKMFYKCQNLDSVTFTNVTFQGGTAPSDDVQTFYGCKSLVSVTLPEAVKIPAGAFAGCTLLSSVNMPKAVEIGAKAFEGCVSLVSVEMPVASKIGNQAFKSCSSFASLNTATGKAPFINVTEFGEEAFMNCAFTKLVLGPLTRTIGTGAFMNNPASEIIIPNTPWGSLIIGARAFKGCPAENIHISSSVSKIGSNAFDYSGTTVSAAEVWFNGIVTNSVMSQNAFSGNYGMTLTMNVNSLSSAVASSFVSQGFVSGMTGVTVEECSSTVIQFSTDEAGIIAPSTVYAIYGGKIVLPYIQFGSTYGGCEFATIDSDNLCLSVFASNADYASGNIAETGDAVPVYPLGSMEDNMAFFGTTDTSRFVNDMEIVTESYGVDVNIKKQTVHYGSEVIMPNFVSSLIKARGLALVRGDGVSYPLDPETTTSVYAGYYFVSLIITSEDTKIEVTFVSKGESKIALVTIQDPFSTPAEVKYMETPDPGFAFMGWYSASDGKGIKAGSETKFSLGQTWYSYFIPLKYTITIVSDTPSYTDSVEVTGPFTLHVVEKSLYYTDLTNSTNVLMFDCLSIPGWYVTYYGDRNNYGREITGDYGASPKLTRNIVIDLYMTMGVYELSLKFKYNGNDIAPSEDFLITGWRVGVTNNYHTGDGIENIPYSEIENGLTLPVPVNSQYTFRELYSVDENGIRNKINYSEGRYALFLANFSGGTSVTLEFIMDMGRYMIEFRLNDDAETVFKYQDSITKDEYFIMPSVQRNYFKTGWTFKGLKITGDDTLYPERATVQLTQEMIDGSVYCVVFVEAVWEKLSYAIEFGLQPYTGTIPGLTGIKVGDGVTLPSVSGYTGYRVSGWYWYKGSNDSESFATDPMLTKEIIDTYADGQTIRMQAEWVSKTYTLKVDPATSYKFDTKTAVYGDSFTLWNNTYTRAYMKFGGWTVGEELYGNSSIAIFNEAMAAIGDANGDVVIFGMKWNSSEYQIRYDLDGGMGIAPFDDTPYIINTTPLELADTEGSFYRDGYTFIGWKYSQMSDIQYVNPSGMFDSVLAQNADSNNVVTLYAMWSQKSYKIQYDFGGGRSGASAPVSVLYGDEVVVSNPTRSGYDFIGWSASNLTAGAMYKSSSGFRSWDGQKQVTSTSFRDLSLTDEDTVTFTAHWKESTYLVTYDLNGGAGIIVGGMTQIRLGENIALPTLRDGTRTGYVYAGWGSDPNNAVGEGTAFTADMVVPGDNSLTLYVIWAPVEYTVKYRFTDEYEYTTINVEYGESISVPTFQKSGFVFDGWDIAGADSTAYYSMNNTDWYKMGSSKVPGTYFKNLTSTTGNVITMNAVWDAKDYRINYRPNGGTGTVPVDGNVYHVGDSVEMKDYGSLSGTNGSKAVVGWSLEPNGTAMTLTEFTEGLAEKADATNAINLYAVWIDGMHMVYINLDGCTPSKIPAGWVPNRDGTYGKLVEYGTDMKSVMADWDGVTLSKEGYSFDSWEYDSSTVTSSVKVTPTFEKVNSNILYIFGGVIAAFAVGAIFYSRLGR